jgi:hypothetical protein
MRPFVPLLALSLAAAPTLAAGAPTVACHCFKDRTFDPAAPAAADPYILAATRSSLLSASFGVEKRGLVKAVMTGTPAEDLWVAHWAAPRVGRPAGGLLQAMAETGSWAAALRGAEGLPAEFVAALGRGAAAGELAALAVDDVLATRLGADRAGLRALRAAGATSEQVIVSTFLGLRLGVPPARLLERFRTGQATWGALLREAGLAPEELEEAIRRSLR